MTGLAATVAALALLTIGAAVLAGLGLRYPSIGLAGFGAIYALALVVFELVATKTIHRRRFQKERVLSRQEDEGLLLELRYRSARCVLFVLSCALLSSIGLLTYFSPERLWSIDPDYRLSAPLVRAINDLTSGLSTLKAHREPSDLQNVQAATDQLASSIDELRASIDEFSARGHETRAAVRVRGNTPIVVTSLILTLSIVIAIVSKSAVYKIASSITATVSLFSGATLLSAEKIEIHTAFGAGPAPNCTPAPEATPIPTPTISEIKLPSSPSFDFRSATPEETTLCGSSTVADWDAWRASVAEIANMHVEGLRDLSIVVIGMADPVRLGASSQASFGSNHGLARKRAEEVVRLIRSNSAFQRSRFVVATDATDGMMNSALPVDVCSPEFSDRRRVKVLLSEKALN